MQISDNLGAGRADPAESALYAKKKNESESSLPFSWGEDKVNISDEARAAQAAASQSGGENAADDDAAGDGKSDAARAFADYMQESRSKAQSSGSPEERLEDLKKKLEKLQSQMAQTAASTNLPEEIKETRIADLSSQVNAVMAQIAELSAETSAKQKQS